MVPWGTVSFCFPRISMFPSTSSRETLRFEGNKIHCSPREGSLSVKCFYQLQIVCAIDNQWIIYLFLYLFIHSFISLMIWCLKPVSYFHRGKVYVNSAGETEKSEVHTSSLSSLSLITKQWRRYGGHHLIFSSFGCIVWRVQIKVIP